MKTKIITMFMMMALVVTLLAGCGGNNEEPNETEDNNDTADTVTTASIVDDAAGFENAISAEGTWIIATLNDLTIDEDLVVEGEFRDKDDEANDLYRKIALYAQDEDHNVTERYTLTAPTLTIKSPNTRIQGGTFVGDVYVENNGFNINDATVDGNVYFTTEEYKDSFSLDEGTVTGDTEVKE